jgi:hypothetical protein
VDGLKLLVITLVYSLPAIVIGLLFGGLVAGLGLASGNGNGELSTLAILLLTCCFIPVMIVFGLGVQVLAFGGLGFFITRDDFAAAFRFGEVLQVVRENLSKFIIIWLVQILCGFVGSLGTILFAIGVLFTTVYGQAVFGNYFGQMLQTINLSGSPSAESLEPVPPAL